MKKDDDRNVKLQAFKLQTVLKHSFKMLLLKFYQQYKVESLTVGFELLFTVYCLRLFFKCLLLLFSVFTCQKCLCVKKDEVILKIMLKKNRSQFII